MQAPGTTDPTKIKIPALESVLYGTSAPPLTGHATPGSHHSGLQFPHLSTAGSENLWCSQQVPSLSLSREQGTLPEQKGLWAGERLRLASCGSGKPGSCTCRWDSPPHGLPPGSPPPRPLIAPSILQEFSKNKRNPRDLTHCPCGLEWAAV